MRTYLPISTDKLAQGAGAVRFRAVNWILLVVSLVAFAIAESASAQSAKKSVVEERTLVTDDSVEIKISYFKSTGGKDAPVIIMLHGKGGNRRQYTKFAQNLQTKGDFAVIAVDLRGHGESTPTKKGELKKSDYENMVTFDMDAVRDFIFDEHQKEQLNMNKQGIVACDFSTSVAMAYTQLDWDKKPYDDSPVPLQGTPRGQDIRALAMISPDTTATGAMGTKAAAVIRTLPIAIMIGAAEKDKGHDLATSKKLYEQFAVKREKDKEKDNALFFAPYPEAERGMDLILHDPTVQTHITDFMRKYVKEFPSEWRDRRSRLERD